MTSDGEGSLRVRKSCFVIAPIGATGSDTRRRSDQVLRHVIRPVVEPLGYDAVRADEIDQAGMITTQVLDRILGDDLVIADLTDQNPNVFYELAVRHAIRKPFVQLMAEGQKIPFDVQGLRTIHLDHTDLDSVASAKEQLGKAIAKIEEGSPTETPMSVALSLQDLKGSGDPEETGISQIMEMIQDLKSDVRRMPRTGPPSTDLAVMRNFIDHLASSGRINRLDFDSLLKSSASASMRDWARKLQDTLDDEPPF